jgi:two-component system phosphate regulon sensor histidine kinase PhoR
LILEKEIQTTDLRWYQMNIIPYLVLSDNSPNGVIITFIEITKRIKDLKDQEKIIAEYETLLDTISHDIKNRLHTMLLSIDLLKSSDFTDQEEIKFCSETLIAGVNKIHLIIEEMFDSKDQKHKYEAVEELLNVENILEDVKFALLSEITKTNASIKMEVNSSEIVFARRNLRSIIFNLVSNAIKFRAPDRDPEIIIRTIQKDGYMVITVKDNGIGIDKENQEAIFSKYYRIENSVSGTGIGLYLVKTLVTRSGGKVEIQSQVGVGTEFKIYLKTKCSLPAEG